MGLFSSILSKFKRRPIDWDELEETLIAGDLGLKTTLEIVDDLQARKREINADDVTGALREHILEILPESNPALEPSPDGPRVVLVAGVNGTGKTTSTAKLAAHLKDRGHSVLLAAADTFRAAAIEQLEVWAGRLEIDIIKGQYKADPSAVCFDAYESATRRGVDFLLCDTAGRLHTRHNLMEELKKMRRTLAKRDPGAPHESLLVVDATTGSNALNQAREFHQALDLTGLVVTKLDGSGKGGIIVAIQKDLGIPARFIGTGEKVDDFQPFDREKFVDEIL